MRRYNFYYSYDLLHIAMQIPVAFVVAQSKEIKERFPKTIPPS